MPAKGNRPLSKLALIDKISHFCADFSQNFENVFVNTVEKFCEKDAKKGNFSDQMEFRKRSNKDCGLVNLWTDGFYDKIKACILSKANHSNQLMSKEEIRDQAKQLHKGKIPEELQKILNKI